MELASVFLQITSLGMEWFNQDDFLKLLVRSLHNLLFVTILIRFIYYRKEKRKDYLFTFMLISMMVFMICFLLDNVKLQLGFALGLFAIFGIIRYRTDTIPIREMTYLFIAIGLSVVNALANKKISYAEVLLTNLIIIFTAYMLEFKWMINSESSQMVNYERIDLIVPEKHAELKADLEKRIGFPINRFSIKRIDFLNDTAQIEVFYIQDPV